MSQFFGRNTAMMAQANANVSPRTRSEQSAFIHRTFGWMAIGLAVTGLVALGVSQSAQAVKTLAHSWVLLIILQLGIGLGLQFAISRISSALATMLFLAYSATIGLTIAILLLVFTTASVFSAFFITAGTFGAMALWGMFTKADLTRLGGIAGMALIGLVIAMVVNMFMHAQGLEFFINIAGVLIFTALTAYDTQRIKYMYLVGPENSEASKKASIMGAFMLYLDFINLFIFILQFMGQQRE